MAVFKIANWELRHFDGEEEPRISEDELARRLGRERRNIRRVVNKLLADGNLNDSDVRSFLSEASGAVAKSSEKLYLNEMAAIQVVMGSTGPVARALHREIAQVYIDYRRNRLVRVVDPEPTPTSDLDLLERNARNLVELVGVVKTSRKIAEDAMLKANATELQLTELSSAVASMAQRRQAAIDSIPMLPPAQGEVAPRTTRSNIVELLRWAAYETDTPFARVAVKVHREFARRYKINFLARAKNEARRTGKSKVSGLDMVEAAGECQRFYDLAVLLFGRPRDPLPPAGAASA